MLEVNFNGFKNSLNELRAPSSNIPLVWCDNTSAAAIARNPVLHVRTKHIQIDAHFVRDQIISHKLEIKHISTRDQIDDCLTKSLSPAHF